MVDEALLAKARRIRLLLTDCDGVLTDSGVYFSAAGEGFRRFSVRDGMGVERLRVQAGVDVGIISGESSGSIRRRAEKLAISELHLGVRDKAAVLEEILARRGLAAEEVAYIGDDTNDLAILAQAGLSAAPADGLDIVRRAVDYVCPHNGGFGAFRDVAELIIAAQTTIPEEALYHVAR